MLYEIIFKIKEFGSLNLYTSSTNMKNKLIDKNSSVKCTIPITEVSCSEVNTNDISYYDSIIINNNIVRKFTYDKNSNLAIIDAKEDEIRLPDLIYIMLAMFSKILARNDKYLIHSSSLVCSSGESFILVGEANAGKTSLGYELMSKYGCKLISNDHSIVGVEDGIPKIYGGTKYIKMRLGAIELYFSDLYKKINIIDEDKWGRKLVVNDYIDQKLILDNECDISFLSDIYSINTNNSANTFIRKKDDIDKFLFMYESLSKIIKGTYNYITGFDYPMPSMEDEKMLYGLSNVCKIISEKCNVCEAKGSISGLARELVRRYEK